MVHKSLRPLEQRLLQIVSDRRGQIFAFGVRNFAAIENGDHFSLGNGISQSFAHLGDRAVHPGWHASNQIRIQDERARHGKHPRKNASLDGATSICCAAIRSAGMSIEPSAGLPVSIAL